MDIYDIWVISVIVGFIIGVFKKQFFPGFFFPLLLGPVGVLVMIFMDDRETELKWRKQQDETIQKQLDEIRERQADAKTRSGTDVAP
jgi:hypothetical protein